ncbi:translation initiation factor IF-2 subunit beta [Candidatus Bathyarchaeota archaeon]|nr:translation initiation factor IF-2 subunit beta [Candidatus Bathyarchaeota archaeon]MBL7079952.1 translation initiation factor IF-2 subunit beta [Candidatus Bathyarchaeota archaeon]
MEKDYKTMLDRAYREIPEQVESYERWTVPRPDVRSVGRRTVIMDFKDIADYLGRDPEHLLKFLSGEMATLPRFDGTRAIFQGHFRSDSIRNLLDVYANKYVVCPVCKRPDTQVVRERRLFFLQCEACGARSSIGEK